MTRVHFSLIVVAGIALQACANDATVAAQLQLSLPQTAGALFWVELSAEQDGTIHEGTFDSESLVATVRVTAGREATLRALVLSSEPAAVIAFTLERSFVVGATETELAFEMSREPGRVGTIRPAFDDDSGLALAIDDLQVIDQATGASTDAIYASGTSLELPLGRAVVLRGTHPVTGASISVPIGPALEDFSTDTTLSLGTPPALPTGISAAPGRVFDASQLTPADGYTLQCALGDTCQTGITWTDCTAVGSTISGDGIADIYGVLVHYAEVPESCGQLGWAFDPHPPRVQLRFSPAFIPDGAPVRADVTVAADESLDPASIELTVGGGANLCPSPTGTGSTLTCSVDFSGATPVAGSYTVLVTGTDLAGNAFSVTAPLVTLAGSAATVEVTRVVTDGFEALPTQSVTLGVEVTNRANEAIGVELLELLNALGYLSADSSLNPIVLEPDASGTVWAEWTPATEIAAGPYQADVRLNWYPATNPQITTEVTRSLPVTLLHPPVGFPAGRLVLSTATSNFEPPTFGGSYANGCSYTLTAVDVAPASGVVTFPPRGTCPIGIGAAGEALLTAEDPLTGDTARVRIEASPASGVAALEVGSGTATVRVATPGMPDVTFSVDTRIGPRQVLWESTSDQLVVVGTDSVQLVQAATPNVIAQPCALTEIVGGYADPPRVSLIGKSATGLSVCHLDPTTGTVTQGASLPASTMCPAANVTHAVGDPFGASVTLLGWRATTAVFNCIASYTLTGTTATLRTDAETTSFGGPIIDVDYDPTNGYIAVLADPGIVGGWHLTGSLTAGAIIPPPFDSINVTGVTAVAVDPATGAPHLASWAYSPAGAGSTRLARLHTHNERLGSGYQTSTGTWTWPGTYSADPLPVTALTIDAANRRAYAAVDGSTGGATTGPFELVAFDLTFSTTPVELGAQSRIRDLTIVGPQPHALQRRRLRPGDLVTLQGVGFAGGGTDEVFVHGVEAAVYASTPFSVTFEVPRALRRITDGLWQADVTVRSHGRLSGPVPTDAYVVREGSVGFVVPRTQPFPACATGGGCGARGVAFSRTSQPWILRGALPIAGDDPFYGIVELGQQGPTNGALALWGRRLLGVTPGGWYDLFFPTFSGEGPVAEAPRIGQAIDTTGTPGTVMAGSPDGLQVAVDVGTGVELFATSSLARQSTGPIPTGLARVKALAYTPSGEKIVAVGDAALAAIDPSTQSASPIDITGCPISATDELLAISAHDLPGEVTAIVSSGTRLWGFVARDLGVSWEVDCVPSVDAPGARAAVLLPSTHLVVIGTDTAIDIRRHLDLSLLASTPSALTAAPVAAGSDGRGGRVAVISADEMLDMDFVDGAGFGGF